MIYNSFVNGEAQSVSYSWCHGEWLLPNPEPEDFLGHEESWMQLLLVLVGVIIFSDNPFCLFHDSENYLDITIGFLDPENIWLAYLYKFLSWLEAEILQNLYFVAAILKIQDGGLNVVCANANIDFWMP